MIDGGGDAAILAAITGELDALSVPLARLVMGCPGAEAAIESDLNRGRGDEIAPSDAVVMAVRACREDLAAWDRARVRTGALVRGHLEAAGIDPTAAMIAPADAPDQRVRLLARGCYVPRAWTRAIFEAWVFLYSNGLDDVKRWARDQLVAIGRARREIAAAVAAKRTADVGA